MAGVHDRLRRQLEQMVPDRLDDRVEVGVGPASGTRPAGEERVAGEHGVQLRGEQAHRPGGVAWCVEHLEHDVLDLEPASGDNLVVGRDIMLGVPEHAVAGMQPDRRAGRLPQLDRGVDVVVVTVRTHDGDDAAARDAVEDRLGVMSGVDDHDLGIVADQPHVVVDRPLPAVDSERPRGDDAVDPYSGRRGSRLAHHTTTDRSTSPRCIRSNAGSTWSSPIVSDTNASRSSRPWR